MNYDSINNQWEKEVTSKVAETAGTATEVIPFVSPEQAAQIYSSQRLLSLEEGWNQVDQSLGRLKDSR